MTNHNNIEYNNRWYSYGSCTNNEKNNDDDEEEEETTQPLAIKQQPIIENTPDDDSPSTTTERRNNFLKANLPLFLLMMIVCMMYLIILCQNILYELKNQQHNNNQVVATTADDASSFVVSSSSSSQKDIMNTNGYHYTKNNEKIPLLGKQRRRRRREQPKTDNKVDETTTTTMITVLIVYIPNDEGQYIMSSRVANGVKSVLGDDEVKIMMESVPDATFEQVLQADAVILGSSVENGNTHPMLQSWINDHWNLSKSSILSQKVGGAFVTAGGMSAGEEGTLHSLIQTMLIFQMIIVGGNNWYSAFGASAVTAEEPFIPLEKAVDSRHDQEEILDFPRDCYEANDNVAIHPVFQQKAFGLGVRVATVVSRLRS